MSQGTAASRFIEIVELVGAKGWRIGLRGKLVCGLVTGSLLLSAVGLVLVRHQVGRIIQSHLDQRALEMASTLGDAAATHILGDNVMQIHALVTKYSLLNGVAYIFITDRADRVLAHSLSTFPNELQETGVHASVDTPGKRTVIHSGKEVYQTHVPILGGRTGVVYIGIWAESVLNETQNAILPVLVLVGVALSAVAIFSIMVTQKIFGRILRLKDTADKMSLGDLETPVKVDSDDEIGDLARSLDRMRSSLRAAMVRISQPR